MTKMTKTTKTTTTNGRALARPARDRRCPSCGGPIDRRAKVCRNCNTSTFDSERGRAAARARNVQARENARLAALARAAGLAG